MTSMRGYSSFSEHTLQAGEYKIGKCVCHQGGSFATQVSVKTLGWRVSESTASTAMSLKNPNASVHKHG